MERFAGKTEIAVLDDLRERLIRTRWPDDPDADPWLHGTDGAYLRELVRYWIDHFDWRAQEQALHRFAHFRADVDGFGIHFLHERSREPNATPLVITHGWPSSVLEPLAVMDALADPGDPGLPAFHVVAPSLPGYGFGGRPDATGWDVDRTADAWVELMGRLGHERFYAAGGDWGGRVTAALGHRHPERVAGLHSFTPYVVEPDPRGPLTATEQAWVEATDTFRRVGGGYSLEHSTRPQTVAYLLSDSPVAQLAWVLDKLWAWTDHDGDLADALSRDQVLDTVSLYWLSGTGGSSARFYWENFPPDNTGEVGVPSAVTVFPTDIERVPRPWVERRFTDLRSFTQAPRGGHFPMLEVPTSYVAELRHAFGTMPW